MPLPYVMPTAPLFYSITMKTEYEPKKVLLTVDVTALVTKEDRPGRSFWDCLCLCNTYNSVLITSLLGRSGVLPVKRTVKNQKVLYRQLYIQLAVFLCRQIVLFMVLSWCHQLQIPLNSLCIVVTDI